MISARRVPRNTFDPLLAYTSHVDVESFVVVFTSSFASEDEFRETSEVSPGSCVVL